MKRLISISLLIATACFAGEDILELKGLNFSNATIQRVEIDGIVIKHLSGITKLYFTELPQEIRDKYGYDPEKHRQYFEAQQRQQIKQQNLRLIEYAAIDVRVKLSQVLEDGSLAYITHRTETVTYDTSQKTMGESRSYSPLSKSHNTLPSGSQGSVVKSETRYIGVKVDSEEPIFIRGLSLGYSDGNIWEGRLYPMGFYNYITIHGAPKKIEQFTPSKKLAVEYLME